MRFILLGVCMLFASCATTNTSTLCDCDCSKCAKWCPDRDGDPLCRKLLRLKCKCQ